MSTNSARLQLAEQFGDKEYRDMFVAEHIFSRLAFKIRALREQRGWSQKQLGDVIGMAQAWISRLENPNYGKLTISTLLKLASAYDVALDIDFVPFSKVFNDTLNLSPRSFKVQSFAEDRLFNTARRKESNMYGQNIDVDLVPRLVAYSNMAQTSTWSITTSGTTKTETESSRLMLDSFPPRSIISIEQSIKKEPVSYYQVKRDVEHALAVVN